MRLGESPWQVIRKKLAQFERELYKDLCWGLVGFRKLELLPQLNFPAISRSTARKEKERSLSGLVWKVQGLLELLPLGQLHMYEILQR